MDMQTLLRFAHKQMVGAAYSTLYVGGLSKKKQSHTTSGFLFIRSSGFGLMDQLETFIWTKTG